jgi:hypothetical protein
LVNSYMSLLRSEIILKFPSYKHIAPPEQGSSHNDGDFLCKAPKRQQVGALQGGTQPVR